MASAGQANLTDWLALHGLDHDDVQTRLVRIRAAAALKAPDPTVPDQTAPDPTVAKGTVLPIVLAALDRAFPAGAGVLATLRMAVRIDLAPDPARFPRAFTLQDDETGLPFVSVPLKGRMSDLLLLMHELGHACQSLAAGRADLPPVQRESAAYLAEKLLLRADPDRALVLQALHRARTARIMARDGAALMQARPNTPYHYNWNYPVARDLAARAAVHLPVSAQWGVYTGDIDLPELLRLPAV